MHTAASSDIPGVAESSAGQATPPKGLRLGLFNPRTTFLFFQREQGLRRHVIKCKGLMRYLILHHFLCFYLVSKREPIYKERP